MRDYEHAAQVYRRQMEAGSEMLLAALRSQHPRIIERLTRGRTTGDKK